MRERQAKRSIGGHSSYPQGGGRIFAGAWRGKHSEPTKQRIVPMHVDYHARTMDPSLAQATVEDSNPDHFGIAWTNAPMRIKGRGKRASDNRRRARSESDRILGVRARDTRWRDESQTWRKVPNALRTRKANRPRLVKTASC